MLPVSNIELFVIAVDVLLGLWFVIRGPPSFLPSLRAKWLRWRIRSWKKDLKHQEEALKAKREDIEKYEDELSRLGS